QTASLTKPELDQADARLRSTQAQVDAARATLATAKTAVDEAALAMADTVIRAPFAGWIAARNIEQGSLAASATLAFSLIDTHDVKAALAIPDISLKNLHPGDEVHIWLDAMNGQVTGKVLTVAPAADPRTHVYAVDVVIDNPKETLRPGMVGSLTI